MGVLVMVIGQSGSGKSTSLRNFGKDEVGVFNVAGKPLPFKGQLPKVDHPGYPTILRSLEENKKHAYVIDDSTYLMQFDNFARAKETGYGKFTDMALAFEKLLTTASHTDNDTVVYFLHHPSFDDAGGSKPQTIGKMLDNQLNIEGLFPLVIECTVKDGKHVFITANDGNNIAKSPIDMLPAEMDNDLKAVDTAIRDYWEMKPLSTTAKKVANAK